MGCNKELGGVQVRSHGGMSGEEGQSVTELVGDGPSDRERAAPICGGGQEGREMKRRRRRSRGTVEEEVLG